MKRFPLSAPRTCLLMLALALAGCRAQAPTAPATPTPATSPAATPAASAADTGTPTPMTPLARLVARYATAPSPTWGTFESAIEGVTWREPMATVNPDARADNAYSRSGTLVLEGFGENDLPNGKAGADADYERGNEGRSGVTLNGTAEEVTSIAVMKFYPDADYARVLARQFSTDTRIRAIAADCAVAEGSTTDEANTTRNAFYEIALPDGTTAYAEGSVDAEGGKYSPGSTTYFFYRSKPVERIGSMQCKAV